MTVYVFKLWGIASVIPTGYDKISNQTVKDSVDLLTVISFSFLCRKPSNVFLLSLEQNYFFWLIAILINQKQKHNLSLVNTLYTNLFSILIFIVSCFCSLVYHKSTSFYCFILTENDAMLSNVNVCHCQLHIRKGTTMFFPIVFTFSRSELLLNFLLWIALWENSAHQQYIQKSRFLVCIVTFFSVSFPVWTHNILKACLVSVCNLWHSYSHFSTGISYQLTYRCVYISISTSDELILICWPVQLISRGLAFYLCSVVPMIEQSIYVFWHILSLSCLTCHSDPSQSV